MFRGMYTIVSSMKANQNKMDIITNNMANTNTNGYKKDLMVSETFPEKFISKLEGRLPNEITENENTVEVQKDGDAYVFRTTNGFFTVAKNAEGTRGEDMNILGTVQRIDKSYSKEVKFARDEEGYLKTFTREIDGDVDVTTGSYLLDKSGNPIKTTPGSELSFNNQGQILEDGQPIANMTVTPPPHVIGTINGGLRMDKIMINFSQGQLSKTDSPLDFAIKGDGFFSVELVGKEPNQNADSNIRYTRDGSFSVNSQGQLVTKEGHLVLGEGGPITIPQGSGNIGLSPAGEIIVDGQILDKLQLVNIQNVNAIRKEGNNLYFIQRGTDPKTDEFKGQVEQGFVEGSNSSAINEMVEMINTYRAYEGGQKVIKAYDDIMAKAVTEIGRLG